MDPFDDLNEGLIYPFGDFSEKLSETGDAILYNLMNVTCVGKIANRNSLTEFLTRVFISFDLPLNHYTDTYFDKEIIVIINSKKGGLTIDLNLLQDLIGTTVKYSGPFNYTGTTEEFLKNNSINEWPNYDYPKMKKNINLSASEFVRNARIVAQFFTDKIHDEFFNVDYTFDPSSQFCRNSIDFECFEIKKAVFFDPLITLPKKQLDKIRDCIGPEKLKPSKNFLVDTYENERLEEVIKIAYGIKNGFINWNGHVGEYEKHVDPYFFISFTPIMDVYLKSKSFMDIYHYWNMCEWMDKLPFHD